MKKLRITVDGKVFDVSVELLDQVSSTTAAPAPAPVAAPAPAASALVAASAPAPAPAPGEGVVLASARSERRCSGAGRCEIKNHPVQGGFLLDAVL